MFTYTYEVLKNPFCPLNLCSNFAKNSKGFKLQEPKRIVGAHFHKNQGGKVCFRTWLVAKCLLINWYP